MPDHRQPSGNDDDQQWTVVEASPPIYDLCQHVYRIVRLRSAAGKLSSGVQCVRCGDVEAVSSRQWAARGSIRYGAEK